MRADPARSSDLRGHGYRSRRCCECAGNSGGWVRDWVAELCLCNVASSHSPLSA
jgi:hypothetical protein